MFEDLTNLIRETTPDAIGAMLWFIAFRRIQWEHYDIMREDVKWMSRRVEYYKALLSLTNWQSKEICKAAAEVEYNGGNTEYGMVMRVSQIFIQNNYKILQATSIYDLGDFDAVADNLNKFAVTDESAKIPDDRR